LEYRVVCRQRDVTTAGLARPATRWFEVDAIKTTLAGFGKIPPRRQRDRRMKRRITELVSSMSAVLLLGFPYAVSAQHPVNSIAGVTLFPEGSLISARLVSRQLQRADGTKDVDLYLMPTNLNYGLNRDLTLGITLPYIRKELSTPAFSTTVEGLGDIILVAKHRYFLKNYEGGTTQFAVVGGVKLATGDTDANAPGGGPLPMSDQLGSGSTDFLLGWSGSWFSKYSRSFHISALYKKNTEGDRNFQFGDFVNYNLSANWLVYHQPYPRPELYLGVELNGEYTRHNELNGAKLADSGGHRLFVSPTFHWFLSRNWNLEGSVQFPILEELNGIQPEENDPRLLLGVRFQFR